jgi:hypothetical protein
VMAFADRWGLGSSVRGERCSRCHVIPVALWAGILGERIGHSGRSDARPRAPPGHPARGSFSFVAAGLLARRSSPLSAFPVRYGTSGILRRGLTAYSCGGSAGFAPASLFAPEPHDSGEPLLRYLV